MFYQICILFFAINIAFELLPIIKCMDVLIHSFNVSVGDPYIGDANYSLIKIPGGYGGRASIRLKEDFGNDNKYLCKVERYRNDKLKPLLNIKGKGACEALNKYLRAYWKMVERLYGVNDPGHCPIPKGSYAYSHYINATVKQFEYLLKLVPNIQGRVRITCQAWSLNNRLLGYGWGEGELIND